MNIASPGMKWLARVLAVLAGLAVVGMVAMRPAGVPLVSDTPSNPDWPRATPEDAGMDGTKLTLARDYALTGGGSGCIIRHGKLVLAWGDPKKLYDLKSTTKSFGAAALGLAIQDGKIRLSDPARLYHPTLGTPPDTNAATGWLNEITILHLASQTAGFDKPGGYVPLLFQPGKEWAYSDSGPNWLAECLTLAYRRDLDELMFERVFAPLGIQRADLVWRKNQYRPDLIDGLKRREFGAGISANVDAMARFGLLWLQGGQWNGAQILPRAYVDQVRVTVPGVPGLPVRQPDEYGRAVNCYGLLWWNNADETIQGLPRDTYWAWGLYDSLIVVMPALDVVVARAGQSWKRTAGADHYDVLKPFLLPIAAAAGTPPAPTAIVHLVHAAGTTSDEMERLRLLRQLDARTDLSATLRADLAGLLPVVDDWANGKSRVVVDTNRAAENGYLCRFITSRVRPASDGPVHPPEPSAGSPLRPIWGFYRGRMLIWQVIQSSPLLSVKERRDKYYGEGRRLLEETRHAFPENRVVRMYLGEPSPWPKVYSPDPEAPAWANLQREGLEKLADVIHWWIAERQLPDGQFGGGWGDDVEMWRWWVPVLIAFDDPAVRAAQERLSDGIFHQPHLREGFTARVTDVEHSNEDTTDTILPMMHLRPEDPVWKQRALRLAELMRDRWTGRNEHGMLQFKSIYFSVDKVDATAARAFDTVYHPSVIQPALLYWQRTGDPALTALFGEWLKVWVDATARAENGKPAGVLPSAIRWPDGGTAKTNLPWWEPFSLGHNDALYNWPGATRLMTSTLLLAYHMTREDKYLDPIRSMAALRVNHQKSAEGEPGSEAWCARRMSGFLPDALAKYRLLTGDTQYDALLRADASGYVRYRLTGDSVPLEAALRRNAEAFRSNWEAYTSEMRWTDRVMAFTRNYLTYLPEPAPPAPSPEILYHSATGDPGNPLVFPLNAVRWRTPPREIAALVTESSRASFAAELFHFGAGTRELDAELFLLSPGEYELTLTPAGAVRSPPLHRRVFRVEGPGTRVSLPLPARRLCVVKVIAR